jgi:deferrochelatase/peroxidase EfeB
MEGKVLVHCQYYENYNVGPDGFGEVPYWKPKGGHTFQMPIDAEIVFFADTEVVVQAIKNMVEKQNSIAEKFEYVEHEFMAVEASIVNGLEQEIDRLYEMAV